MLPVTDCLTATYGGFTFCFVNRYFESSGPHIIISHVNRQLCFVFIYWQILIDFRISVRGSKSNSDTFFLLSNVMYRKLLRSQIYPHSLELLLNYLSSIITLRNIAKCWQCRSHCVPSVCPWTPNVNTNKHSLHTAGSINDELRADCITHLLGTAASNNNSDLLAVLTASKGLQQRLEADVKEARILLAGRHGCRGYVATVTDSRAGTGRQDEALQTEQVRERGERSDRNKARRKGEKDAGGQRAMRMLRLSTAECVCLFACVHEEECVYAREKEK